MRFLHPIPVFGHVWLMWLALMPWGAAAPKVVAYVPNWIDLPAFAQTIDYHKVTHLNLAFENPVDAEGTLSFHAKNTALIEKARQEGVKILVSIGGGGAADNKTLQARYFDLIGSARRARFAATLADYVTTHQFDGLDVDLEGPSINEDYGGFIEALAKVFRERRLLLTAALSKGYGGNRVPDSVFAHFDFINIMAYDGTGPWNPNAPGQHSSMDFAKENVAYWLGRGLPREKAVLGVPFYGYGFGNAAGKNYPYAAILAAHPGAEGLDQVGDTIWYNGKPTIRDKTAYALEQRLGGLMIWSLNSDVKGEHSLLTVIHDTLRKAHDREATP